MGSAPATSSPKIIPRPTLAVAAKRLPVTMNDHFTLLIATRSRM
jgi:hypothetical protein